MGGWEEQIPFASLPPAEGTKGPSSSPPSDYASGNFGNFYDSGTGYDVNGYSQGYNNPGDGSGQLFGQPTEVSKENEKTFVLLKPEIIL